MAICNANSCLIGTTLLRHRTPLHVVRSKPILHGLCTSECLLCLWFPNWMKKNFFFFEKSFCISGAFLKRFSVHQKWDIGFNIYLRFIPWSAYDKNTLFKTWHTPLSVDKWQQKFGQKGVSQSSFEIFVAFSIALLLMILCLSSSDSRSSLEITWNGCTVNILNIRTPEELAVITLNFEKGAFA